VGRKMTNPKKGVSVRITGQNATKVLKITDKTHRTFACEVNIAVQEYADDKIVKFRDNGK
jgi:predicted nucleic-acid-binding Zn-ribbon protein